ncbi:C1q-like domain-containing protein [Dyadobacter sandarakinus]|uniref:C1q domain-containing protein n=1 Tax=Dyadobacter sandarakinus TaxID=2747268 RepID=A0ABX7I9I4_9BACT|nr:hypothetical protein [Dyadobacter sandarakinus]QRR01833.1 hypothetical protein HWI92_13400 [Dyadobacter sandarakinus]
MVSLENAKGAASNALHTYSVQGYALDSYGKVRLTGGSSAPALGKELTSDVQGNATWEGAVAFRASGIVSGSEKLFGGLPLEEKIPFSTEEYDLTGNYSNSTGTPQSAFVAPVKGIYNFNVGVSWTSSVDVSALVVMEVRRLRAGVVTKLGEIVHDNNDGSLTMATDALLEANDQVFITIRHTAAQKFITLQNPTFFTGKLMIRQ